MGKPLFFRNPFVSLPLGFPVLSFSKWGSEPQARGGGAGRKKATGVACDRFGFEA